MTLPPPARRPAARYDLAALCPPDPGGGTATPDPAAWQALRHWCLAGSGPGTRPPWAPRGLPAVQLRLKVAQLLGPDARALSRLATQFMLERDGSLQLQACRTAPARLALRLQTLLHERLWWRPRQASDPWDSGHVRATPAGLQAAMHFMPRRASLLVADGLPADALAGLLQNLQSRQAGFTCPVRLLVLGPVPEGAAVECTAINLSSPQG